MRVALYARVSSNRQREEQTIESQVAALGEFAAAQGWSLDQRHRYVDNGASGFYFDRPALDRLRDAARDGLIDLLLIHDPDPGTAACRLAGATWSGRDPSGGSSR